MASTSSMAATSDTSAAVDPKQSANEKAQQQQQSLRRFESLTLLDEHELEVVVSSNSTAAAIQLSRRRLPIALIFGLSIALNSYQLSQFNQVHMALANNYHHSSAASPLNQSSSTSTSLHFESKKYQQLDLVPMFQHFMFVVPAILVLNIYGIQFGCSLGLLFTLVGSVLKCFYSESVKFLIAGQLVCSIGQPFLLTAIIQLTTKWFGSNEIGKCIGFFVLSHRLGSYLGDQLTPLLAICKVSNGSVFDRSHLMALNVTLASFGLVLLILTTIIFRNQPKMAPSVVQLESIRRSKLNEKELKSFRYRTKAAFKSFGRVLSNKNYLLILASFGLFVGSFQSFTFLYEEILKSHAKSTTDNFKLQHCLLYVSACIGALIFGILIDLTKSFKLFIVLTSSLAILSLMLLIGLVDIKPPIFSIIFSCSIGLFMTGYVPVAYEYASEVIYGDSEATACGLLNSFAFLLTFMLIYLQRFFIKNFNNLLVSNLVPIIFLVISFMFTVLLSRDYRIQHELKKSEISNKTLSNSTSNSSAKTLINSKFLLKQKN